MCKGRGKEDMGRWHRKEGSRGVRVRKERACHPHTMRLSKETTKFRLLEQKRGKWVVLMAFKEFEVFVDDGLSKRLRRLSHGCIMTKAHRGRKRNCTLALG